MEQRLDVMVCKDTKINSKGQAWTVLRQRPDVSARVFDPIAGLATYRTASLAMSAANVSLSLVTGYDVNPLYASLPGRWKRTVGRGSAVYYAQQRTDSETIRALGAETAARYI